MEALGGELLLMTEVTLYLGRRVFIWTPVRFFMCPHVAKIQVGPEYQNTNT